MLQLEVMHAITHTHLEVMHTITQTQLEVMHTITNTHNECYTWREFTPSTTSTTWMHLYYTVLTTLSSLHCLAKETTSESIAPTTLTHLIENTFYREHML